MIATGLFLRLFPLGITQMDLHLRAQHPFNQTLAQPVESSAGGQQILRLLAAFQQLIQYRRLA
jgi:hypothetical protein